MPRLPSAASRASRAEEADFGCAASSSGGACGPNSVELTRVVQFVGHPGDIVLLHPLSLHSGTTNWRGRPRLMGNGMVRLRPEAFARRGGCFYRPQVSEAAVAAPH